MFISYVYIISIFITFPYFLREHHSTNIALLGEQVSMTAATSCTFLCSSGLLLYRHVSVPDFKRSPLRAFPLREFPQCLRFRTRFRVDCFFLVSNAPFPSLFSLPVPYKIEKLIYIISFFPFFLVSVFLWMFQVLLRLLQSDPSRVPASCFQF